MLNFQDFSKFSKILKSTVQYLSRDISNVKIGQFLRQNRTENPLFALQPSKSKNSTYHPTSFLNTSRVVTLFCSYLYVCVCIETIESTWVVKRGTAPSIYRYVCMWLKN